jgi:phage gp36-like protein
MGYCEVADVREALAPGGGSTDTQTAADLPDQQIQDCIERASSVIDVSIGGRYITPVAAGNGGLYPHPVDFWCISIAAYLATCVYRGSADFTDNDPIYRQYIVAQASITDIKNGIGTLSGVPPVTGSSPGSASGAAPPVNPFYGTLFAPSDFDLFPTNSYLPRHPEFGVMELTTAQVNAMLAGYASGA